MLNDILSFDQLYPTNQTFHQFHDLDTEHDLYQITIGFHGIFVTGVACQQETLTLLVIWSRPAFWDLLMLKLLRSVIPNSPCLISTFHPEYQSVLSRICTIPRDSLMNIMFNLLSLIMPTCILTFCIQLSHPYQQKPKYRWSPSSCDMSLPLSLH